MSSQKGNISRTRPQKHKNRAAFKNNLHDTSHTTKMISNIQVGGVCMRCKEVIEWKIKYKKYKPLTQPRKCIKCDEKNVKQAYHVMCNQCGMKLGVCTKCCQKKEVIINEKKTDLEMLQMDNEMKAVIQTLSERKRRTFLRFLDKQSEGSKENVASKEDIQNKLDALKIDDDDDLDDDFSLSDD